MDPAFGPNPPKAKINTFVGRGIGHYNGADGYTISFTFTDAGEPGINDTADIVITAPNGNVVLRVSRGRNSLSPSLCQANPRK